MSRQSLLLTAHKGIDLHAATAARVMSERLDGGEALRALYRCEMHAPRAEAAETAVAGAWPMRRILDTGRYFNPNKHHFGHFAGPEESPFAAPAARGPLARGWAGSVVESDLEADGAELYDTLLGGAPGAGLRTCDVVAWPRGQEAPVLSGVVWRLVLRADSDEEAAELGELLAVARGRKQGLLINPHMENWLLAIGEEKR